MLPKQNRLKNKKDFETLFKNGKGCKGDFIYIKFSENNSENSRFGFIVSTKFSKKAVLRNKIKRLLREVIKAKIKDIKKGIDVAIIINPGLKYNNIKELDIKIENLFKKAKLIN